MKCLKKIIIIGILVLGLTTYAYCYEIKDGTHSADVTTESGVYSVPVEVSGGSVILVHWPNGGDMHVYGASVDSYGSASGTNSKEESVDIKLTDLSN